MVFIAPKEMPKNLKEKLFNLASILKILRKFIPKIRASFTIGTTKI